MMIVCIILLTLLLAASIFFNFKFVKIILNIEDSIPEALDRCDDAYSIMTSVLELPVAYDTPEIKQIIDSIKKTREAILYISNILASPLDGVEEEKDVEDKEKSV